MKYFIFVATHWGYIEGGINSFNFDICVSLGKITKGTNNKVICISLCEPSFSLVIEAEKSNVEIFTLKKIDTDFSIQNDLKTIKEKINSLHNPNNIYFLGHDVFTGEITNFLSKDFGSNSESIVFHHMDYEAYYAIKGVTSSQLEQKITKQKNILEKANYIIGVGPKLKKSAEAKTKKPVNQIIPGIHNIELWKKIDKLIGITFGRYDINTDKLKQMGLAAKAFANFVENNPLIAGSDPTLKIIGLEDNKNAVELKNIYAENITQYVNILLLPYKSNREELFKELSQSNLCLMLSIHEGFGLAGLEAIAAGVPLILSENSGLFQFLNSELRISNLFEYGIVALRIKGSNDGTINKIDLKNVQEAIFEIRKRKDYYRNGIIKLKKKLAKKFSWNRTAHSLLQIIESQDKNPKIKLLPKEENFTSRNLLTHSVESNMNIYDLKIILESNFNLTEIKEICFALGIDYEIISGREKTEKIIELIKYLLRRSDLNRLISLIYKIRPNLSK